MKLHMPNRSIMRSPLPRRLVMSTVAACFMAISFSSIAGVFVSVSIAPPPLPIYAQPVMPGDGYMWTPGYWAYAGGGYFWVPGTWVLAPYVGALWTPGYWGWNNGFYVFNAGYWGPHVGFYGGVNYGYGYGGEGYRGGYWNNGRFNYNRNVGYSNGGGRVSYNGGRGGLMARPTPQDQLAAHDRHTQPLAAQQQQVRMASQNRELRASVNHGAPTIAATPRPGVFSGHGVVRTGGTVGLTGRPVSGAGEIRTPHSVPRSASYAPHYVPHSRGGSTVGVTGRPPTGAGEIRTPHSTSYHPTTTSYHPATTSYHPVAQPHPQAPRQQPQPRGGNPPPRKDERH
jgi:WXXGXW repeat (2 copies)